MQDRLTTAVRIKNRWREDRCMVEKQELEARFKELASTDRAGIMLVLIQGQKEEKLFGQIINRCLRRPILFFGMDQLILKTDEICERIGTPKLSMAPRFLREEEKERYQELSRKKKELEKKAGDWHRMSDLLQTQAPMAREILEIQVLFRGNATMQGRFRCPITGRNYISFRSALELQRMLREVESQFCTNNRSDSKVPGPAGSGKILNRKKGRVL